MISTLTMSFVANAVSLAWKRKKLYFEFKVSDCALCVIEIGLLVVML